jgi:hypothetical protein
MIMQNSSRVGKSGLAVITLALLFGWSSLPGVAGTKTSAPASHASAPASHASAPASHPAASSASHSGTSTAGHTTTTTAGHTTTTTAGHTTTTTAGHTTTTTAGHTTTASAGHATTAAGGHATAGGGAAGHNAGGTTAAKGTTPSQHFSSGTPKGSTEHATKDGGAVRTRADGHVADVHDAKRGIDVHHGLDGGRRVSHDLPGHGRMVAERGRRGYVQRGYGYHGHDYGRRAYYYHGH